MLQWFLLLEHEYWQNICIWLLAKNIAPCSFHWSMACVQTSLHIHASQKLITATIGTLQPPCPAHALDLLHAFIDFLCLGSYSLEKLFNSWLFIPIGVRPSTFRFSCNFSMTFFTSFSNRGSVPLTLTTNLLQSL